jgi:hypothetical protein
VKVSDRKSKCKYGTLTFKSKLPAHRRERERACVRTNIVSR